MLLYIMSKLSRIADGYARVDDHHERCAHDQGYWRQLVLDVEGSATRQEGNDGFRRRGVEQGIAVRLRRSDHLRSKDASRAGLVLNDESLVELFGQLLCQESSRDVDAAAG